jgi:ribosomal protein L11 methyltransferase
VIPPQSWQISVLTTARGEQAASGVLEQVFGLPSSVYSNADTGAVTVSVYPETLPGSLPTVRSFLAESLRQSRPRLGEARLIIKRLRRENWAESWKRHFKPIEVGTQLLIKPSWSRKRARAGQHCIILDPGLSFGTGHHPTTLFCLRQLVRLRRRGAGQSFLDIGTGSGILAIAAAKLGYRPVVAFDNDPESIRTARRNINHNKVRLTLRLADLTKPSSAKSYYDLICANLIGDLLAREAGKIRNMLKPHGNLVVAGVLRREFPEIERKLQRFNLTSAKNGSIKEWKSGVFTSVRK